jgi:Putative zinc-finger
MTQPPDHLPPGPGEDDHPDEELLSAHLDSELDIDERSEVSAHLARCAACRQRLRILTEAASSVARDITPLPELTKRRQVARALAEADLEDAAARDTRRSLYASTGRWAAAAVFVLVIAGGLFALSKVGHGSSASPSSASTTTNANLRYPGPPVVALRFAEGTPYPGCSSKAPPSRGSRATSLYDAPASTKSGRAMCVHVSTVIAGTSNAHVSGVSRNGTRFAAVTLSVPPAFAKAARAARAVDHGRAVAVVVGDEIFGYLSARQPAGAHVTLELVPDASLGPLRSELRSVG